MKSGKGHRVLLSAAALTTLEAMTSLRATSGLIFPGQLRHQAMDASTLRRALHRAGHRELTVHGFRSTFRDWRRRRRAIRTTS
jgi:hypothetical protein